MGTPSAVFGFHYGRAQAHTKQARPFLLPRRRATRTQSHRGLHCHLTPGRVRVLVPLLLSVNTRCPQRLLREGLTTPVALVSALWLPLVLVTPIELALTCTVHQFSNNDLVKIHYPNTTNTLKNAWTVLYYTISKH